MTPRIVTVKPDTPVTYRVYLSHRLPPGKKGGIAGPICNCRTAWLVQVPRSLQQQHLVILRKTLAQAASKMVASHHALPAESFSVAVDRAVILYRRARAARDQNLPGVDIRGEEGSENECCWEDADEAVRFWTGYGLAVPVWVEFYARTPPDRAHSFTVPGKALPPRGNEIAVHQALANEEAQIRQLSLRDPAALTPISTPTSASSRTVVTASDSTTPGSCHSSTFSDDGR